MHFYFAKPHFFFQAPLYQRQVKQMLRQTQSTIIAHQTPRAPQPRVTQSTCASVSRNTAMDMVLTHMGKTLSLAARKGAGIKNDSG